MINLLKNRKKLYAAAILTGCCFLLACENDADKVKDWTKKVIMQEEATDIESYLSQNGVMKARLKAPKMTLSLKRAIFSKSSFSMNGMSLPCR